jgi:hypothetical protein
MDGFGDNFDQPEVDPAAEFLAREHDQLAGLEDELNPVAAAPPVDGILYICHVTEVVHFITCIGTSLTGLSDKLNGDKQFCPYLAVN